MNNQHNIFRRILTKYFWLFVLAICFAIALPIFGTGLLSYCDHPIHQAEIQYLNDKMLPDQGWITGWSDMDFCGYPMFLYKGHLCKFMVIFLIRLGISIKFAYKFMVLLSIILPCLIFAGILKKHFGEIPALFAACFLLSESTFLGWTMAGMWEFNLTLAFLFLYLKYLYSFISKPQIQTMLWPILFLALIILSHPYVALIACVSTLGAVAFIQKNRWKVIGGLGAIIVFAMLICAYYIYPILDTRGWSSVKSSKTESLLSMLFYFAGLHESQPAILFLLRPQILINVLAIPGIWQLVKNRNNEKLHFNTTLWIYVIPSITAICLTLLFQFNIPFKKMVNIQRLTIFVRIAIILFSAYYLKVLLENFSVKKLRAIFYVVVFYVMVFVFGTSVVTVLEMPTHSTLSAENKGELEDLFGVIKNYQEEHNDDFLRVVIQGPKEWEGDKYSHMYSFLPGINNYTHTQLGSWDNLEPYSNRDLFDFAGNKIFGKGYDLPDAKKIQHKMILFGARLIVATRDNLKTCLEKSTLFNKIKSARISDVYEIIDFPEPSGFVTITFENATKQTPYYSINDRLVLPIQYHPYWTSNYGQVIADKNHLIDINNIEKDNIVLSYSSYNPTAFGISAISAALLLAGLIALSCRRIQD